MSTFLRQLPCYLLVTPKAHIPSYGRHLTTSPTRYLKCFETCCRYQNVRTNCSHNEHSTDRLACSIFCRVRNRHCDTSMQEAKAKIPVDAHTYLGWERNSEVSHLTGLPDHKESIQVAYDQRGWGADWPTEACCPGFRDTSLHFMHQCHELCLFILSCFAEGLGLPVDTFAKVKRPYPSRCFVPIGFRFWGPTCGQQLPVYGV